MAKDPFRGGELDRLFAEYVQRISDRMLRGLMAREEGLIFTPPFSPHPNCLRAFDPGEPLFSDRHVFNLDPAEYQEFLDEIEFRRSRGDRS